MGSGARALRANREISDAWGSLAPAERELFQRKADEMEAARQQLKATTLSSATSSQQSQAAALSAAAASLSPAQVKRLHGARLDRTLQAFAEHRCWQQGLALGDHISALRASLVLAMRDTDKAEMSLLKQEFQNAIGYDANVEPNPASASKTPFMRPCCSLHAGICKEDLHFNRICKLTSEFDAAVQKGKLGADPFLVQLRPEFGDDPPEEDAETWLIVAGVTRRPVSHTVMHLHVQAGVLNVSLRDSVPHMATMHRVIRALLGAHVARSGAPSLFSLRVS